MHPAITADLPLQHPLGQDSLAVVRWWPVWVDHVPDFAGVPGQDGWWVVQCLGDEVLLRHNQLGWFEMIEPLQCLLDDRDVITTQLTPLQRSGSDRKRGRNHGPGRGGGVE